jgi:hypothetical protein
MTKPTHVRKNAVIRALDSVQSTLELLEDKREKKGAILALNAVRKHLDLPLDGEQIELFEEGKK